MCVLYAGIYGTYYISMIIDIIVYCASTVSLIYLLKQNLMILWLGIENNIGNKINFKP